MKFSRVNAGQVLQFSRLLVLPLPPLPTPPRVPCAKMCCLVSLHPLECVLLLLLLLHQVQMKYVSPAWPIVKTRECVQQCLDKAHPQTYGFC